MSTWWWKTHWLLEEIGASVLIQAKAPSVSLTIEFATLAHTLIQWNKSKWHFVLLWSYFWSHGLPESIMGGPYTNIWISLWKLLFYKVITLNFISSKYSPTQYSFWIYFFYMVISTMLIVVTVKYLSNSMNTNETKQHLEKSLNL